MVGSNYGRNIFTTGHPACHCTRQYKVGVHYINRFLTQNAAKCFIEYSMLLDEIKGRTLGRNHDVFYLDTLGHITVYSLGPVAKSAVYHPISRLYYTFGNNINKRPD